MQAFGPLSTLFRNADRPRATDAEIAWYMQHVPRRGLGLELMCGYGRLLAPLVTTGGKFHGVDQSPAMLACCEEKLVAHGAPTPTFRQDIVQMNLPFRYGCAFVAGGSFQLISDAAEVAAALERIR
ncbi:MAG: class I SAM-dependent methyltransferase, partial [Casimicrobiaceae bacterium]